MKNNDLYNKIMKDMDKLIIESLSISKNVIIEANKLQKFLMQDFQKQISKYEENLTFRENSFHYNLFDFDFLIQYKIFTKDFNLAKFYTYGLTDILSEQKTLTLNLYLNSGIPSEEYFESLIYHELLHIYQYKMSKHDVLSNSFLNKLYMNIKIIYANKEIYSDDELTFTNALYASFDFEQDAMCHGLYGRLMSVSSDIINPKNILYNSQEYEFIYDMEWVLENLDKFPDIFDISKEKYQVIIEKSLNRFKTHIGKAYIQYKEDSKFRESVMIPNKPK